jgi:hypothetical protein
MHALDAYLATHYLTTGRFAAACSLPTHALAALIDDGLVPRPAYVITTDGLLVSAAFGEMPGAGAMPGDYHHPAGVRWVSLALRLQATPDRARLRDALQERFRANFAIALAALDRDTHRLRDSFSDDGRPIGEGIDLRTRTAWSHFIHGIFGVCVADPSSEHAIARKEILQEALVEITADGARTDFPQAIALRVRRMVDEYAACTMPFAPPEYPRSSRKRLVDDLRRRLRAMTIPPGPEPTPCASPA